MKTPEYPNITPEFEGSPFGPIGEMYRLMLEGIEPGSTELIAFSDVLELNRIKSEITDPERYELPLEVVNVINAAKLALIEDTIRNRKIGSDATRYRSAFQLADETFVESQKLAKSTAFERNGMVYINHAIIKQIDAALNNELDSL